MPDIQLNETEARDPRPRNALPGPRRSPQDKRQATTLEIRAGAISSTNSAHRLARGHASPTPAPTPASGFDLAPRRGFLAAPVAAAAASQAVIPVSKLISLPTAVLGRLERESVAVHPVSGPQAAVLTWSVSENRSLAPRRKRRRHGCRTGSQVASHQGALPLPSNLA